MRDIATGHYFTLWPFVRDTLSPPIAPHSSLIRIPVDDPLRGTITLTARMSKAASTAAILIVHGLGGSATSPYVVRAARVASDAGLATIRLNLRGADRRGEDIYHAGLTADLHATLASPELADFEHLFVIGYSLGGHVSLRLATESHDPRVRAVVAVCPPLDLAASADALDAPGLRLYRRHVLAGLKEIFAEVARHHAMPLDVRDALAIDLIRSWDDRVVAPRFGLEGADDYYAKMSVAPRLGRADVPCLVVVAEHDPMVPTSTVRPALDALRGHSFVRAAYVGGGHVGFPGDLDLGIAGAARGLDTQVLAFLRSSVA